MVPAGESLPLAASGAAPAHVRFVARPWAEVQIGDSRRFLTPRAQALPLEPGRHRVVFEHPRFGRAEYDIEVASGEQRVVRHVFEGVAVP